MLQLIAFIIFIISVIGIFFILGKKTPLLARLPHDGHHGFKKHRIILHAEKKIKEALFHVFERQMWLHKLLSFIKVWTLKTEVYVDHLLHGIRKKAQELDKEVRKRK